MILVKEGWETDYDNWYSTEPYDDREFFTDIANGIISIVDLKCEIEVTDGLIDNIHFISNDLSGFYIDGFDFDHSYSIDIDSAESDFVDALENYTYSQKLPSGNYKIVCNYEQFYKAEVDVTKYGDDTYDVDNYSVDTDGNPTLNVLELTEI